IDKTDNSQYTSLKSIFEKSLAVSRDLPAGHTLTFDDLEAKKPAGQGIPASAFREVIGKRLARSLRQYDFLGAEDLEEVDG
ncbi:MAG: SAF domain-containing protein, partial [Bacteroidota bacterium]